MAEETQEVQEPDTGEQQEPEIPEEWVPFAHVAEPWMMEKYRNPDEVIKSAGAMRRQETAAEQRARDLEKHVQELNGYIERIEKQYQTQPQNTQPPPPQRGPQPGFDRAALMRQTGGIVTVTPEGEVKFDEEKMAAVMEVNDLVQQQVIAQMVAEQVAAALGTYDQERVGPIASRAEKDAAAQELAELNELYDDDFDTVAEIAERMHAENPGIREAGGLKALFGLASTDLQKQRNRLRAMEARGYTIDEGGRPKPPPPRKTAEEAALEDIEAYAKRRGDRGVI